MSANPNINIFVESKNISDQLTLEVKSDSQKLIAVEPETDYFDLKPPYKNICDLLNSQFEGENNWVQLSQNAIRPENNCLMVSLSKQNIPVIYCGHDGCNCCRIPCKDNSFLCVCSACYCYRLCNEKVVFSLDNLFMSLKQILHNNSNIKRLILDQSFAQDWNINLPENWEDKLLDSIKGSSVIRLELINVGGDWAIYDFTDFPLNRNNSHKDFISFLLQGLQSGIKELNFGNTRIFRSLPSSQKEEYLTLPRSTLNPETCSWGTALGWLLCCPIFSTVAFCCNPNNMGNKMDIINENERKRLLDQDQAFLVALIQCMGKFESFSADFSNFLKYMARFINRKHFETQKTPQGYVLPIENSPPIVDLSRASKAILEANTIRSLSLNNLELNFATENSRLEFLKALFEIKSLQELSLSGCNLFSKVTSAKEIRAIASLIATSNI